MQVLMKCTLIHHLNANSVMINSESAFYENADYANITAVPKWLKADPGTGEHCSDYRPHDIFYLETTLFMSSVTIQNAE